MRLPPICLLESSRPSAPTRKASIGTSVFINLTLLGVTGGARGHLQGSCMHVCVLGMSEFLQSSVYVLYFLCRIFVRCIRKLTALI